MQANVVGSGVGYGCMVKLPSCPQDLNCCRQSAEEGRCLGNPTLSHPTPTHPPLHPDCFRPPQLLLPCLVQLRDDLLCFLVSTGLAGG